MLAPYLNKTAFIEKASEKDGLKEVGIVLKQLIAKIIKSIKKALDILIRGDLTF